MATVDFDWIIVVVIVIISVNLGIVWSSAIDGALIGM